MENKRLEIESGNELGYRKIILEHEISNNQGDTPQWNSIKENLAVGVITFYNSAVAAFIPAFVFGVGIISIILYLIFR